MNIYAIPPLLTGLILSIIGLFVFLKDKTSKLNIIFSLFSLSMVIWLFGYTNMYLSKEPSIALKWARIGFLGIIFIPIFAYHFIISFLNLKRKIVLPIIYLLAIPSLLLSQTNYIYSGIKEHFWGYYPVAGRNYFVFLSMFGVLFTRGVLLLVSYLRKESGLRRNQIKYVCLAFGLGTFGIVDYLVKYPIFDVYPFGYVCALLFISLIAFAIVRHHLMDITILAIRILIFVIVYSILLVIPLFTFFASKAILTQILSGANWWLLTFSIGIYAAIASSTPFIYLYFQRRAEKILRKEQLEYQEKLRQTSSTIMLTKDLDKLLKAIVFNVVDIVRVAWAAIYLKDEKESKYIRKYQRAREAEIDLPKELAFASELVKRFHQEKLPLIGEEIHPVELKVGLAVPCFLDSNMIGFLLLGDKPKGRMYDQSDVNEFTLLSNQTALAIENCQFYVRERQAEHSRKISSLDIQSASMAHEIDNPNQTILRCMEGVEIILEELEGVIPKEKMEQLKYKLSRGKYNSTRISKMLEAVREYCQVSTGEFRATGLKDLMKSYHEVVKPQLKYNGVDFKYELPQESVWLRANKIELEEVLVNLTTNSVQAILEMPKDHKREINLKAYRTGADQNTLRIDLSDTGSGIEAKLIVDIFLDFVTTKASSVGTGLGLSISRKIIERHKGKIWAESEGKDKGAAFHIELPIPTDITEEEIKQAEELRINKEKRLMI